MNVNKCAITLYIFFRRWNMYPQCCFITFWMWRQDIIAGQHHLSHHMDTDRHTLVVGREAARPKMQDQLLLLLN